MYQNYWGLSRGPFTVQRDGSHLFQGDTEQEALLRLHYLVDQQRRLGLLIGGSGYGKSAILDQFAAELRQKNAQVAQLNTLGLDLDEFVWELADGLGLVVNAETTRAVAWRTIFDRLLVNRYQHVSTVILLDDVDESESEVLTSIARLVQWQPATATRVTVVVTANADRIELLGRRLLQLCDLQVDLAPWEQADTIDFLRQSMQRAGREQPAFDQGAEAMIHELAQGVPRRVRQLADLALLAGAGQQMPLIDADIVKSAGEELAAPVAMSVY